MSIEVPAQKKSKVDVVERSSEITAQTIPWLNVYTTNTREAAVFYEELLGWKPQYVQWSDQWLEVKGPKADGTNVALHHINAAEVEGKPGNIAISVFVKDLTKFHEHVKDLPSVKVVDEPKKQHWGGFIAHYESPDGVRVSVLQDDRDKIPQKPEEENVEKPKEIEATAVEKKESSNGTGEGICHVEIPCGDSERISKFFTDVFGWTFSKFGPASFFKTNDDKNKMQGSLVVTEERIKFGCLLLEVRDISATLEKVKAHGGAVVKEKHAPIPSIPQNKFAKISDSEGNVWSLFCVEAKQNLK